MGHTDTDNTTALYIPSPRMLVAGDVVYNETHAFLVETDRDGRGFGLKRLIEQHRLSLLQSSWDTDRLIQTMIPDHILATRRYIEDFHRLDRETATAEELYFKMLELYPTRVNPGSLWGSARAAKLKN